MVSGSLSLPSRGSFHLSLTVLVRYRSAASTQPWRVGPPDSGGVSRVPPYLGSRPAGRGLRGRGCHPLWRAFPGASPRRRPRHVAGPATPGGRPPGLGYVRLRSPLLTESMFLSFPPATEMFHFAGSRAPPPWIHGGAASGWMPGCPIRKSTDQRPHASPRGLSQLAASFLACRRQGIRHAPVQPGRQIHGARRGRPGRTGPLLSLLPGRALGGRAPRFCC